MVDVTSSAALALRALQKYDELVGIEHRYLLIEAETHLGDLLGLDCTGDPSSWTPDGAVLSFDHEGDTCPVHEWLVPSDQKEVSP